MHGKRCILLLLLWPVLVVAQHYDLASELSAAAGFKAWRGGSISLSEKARFTQSSTRYSQSKTAIVLQQSILRRQLDLYDLRLRFGAGYTFINRLSDPYMNPYYENQHRLMTQASLGWRYGFWRFAARLRAQGTFRDASRGDYRYNPKLALRFRLSAAYALPDRPWKFAAHTELFYRANDPRGAFIDEWRTTAEATYLLDRHSSLTFYAKYFHELQQSNPLRMLALGLRYNFE